MKMARHMLLVAALLVSMAVPSLADDTLEAWGDLTLKFRQPNGSIVWLSQDVRSGDGFRVLRFAKTSLGATVPLGKDADAGAFVAVQFTDGAQREIRPSLQARVRWEGLGARWQLRERIEQRNFVGRTAYRWRSQLRAEWSPWFVSEEAFFDVNSMTLTQNRVNAGRGFKLPDGVDLSVYYVLASEKRQPQWLNRHGLGATITITF
jgi:hypothetical protein